MSSYQQVVIGVDPHKLSATIEVVDRVGIKLGEGRFATDKVGFAAMKRYVNDLRPDAGLRVWAVEGANGAGRSVAQRLLAAGEAVVDVPAKLAARVRLFDTRHNRKTDARDAHSIATSSAWSRPAASTVTGCVCCPWTGSSRRSGCCAIGATSSRGNGSRP